MRPYRFKCLLGMALAVSAWDTAAGGNAAAISEFSAAAAVAASQEAIGTTVGDHKFTDSKGRMVSLAEFRGKPLVVSMIYSSCEHTCPMLTNHLAQVVDVGLEALGADSFEVVSIGFDTRADTPERMGLYAAQRGIRFPEWHFLSSDEDTIEALARETGFQFSPAVGGFDHLAQTTVIDSQGKVSNQIYGRNFEAPLLIDSLKSILRGQAQASASLESLLRDIKLLCTVYDPTSGRYHFDYSLIIAAIVGALCLSAVLLFVMRQWRMPRP